MEEIGNAVAAWLDARCAPPMDDLPPVAEAELFADFVAWNGREGMAMNPRRREFRKTLDRFACGRALSAGGRLMRTRIALQVAAE